MKKTKKSRKKPAKLRSFSTDYDRPVTGEHCSYWFEEHGTHARQQCKRMPGHVGPHHCGGIKKPNG